MLWLNFNILGRPEETTTTTPTKTSLQNISSLQYSLDPLVSSYTYSTCTMWPNYLGTKLVKRAGRVIKRMNNSSSPKNLECEYIVLQRTAEEYKQNITYLYGEAICVDLCCWFLSLLRGIYSGTSVYLPPQKPTFVNSTV